MIQGLDMKLKVLLRKVMFITDHLMWPVVCPDYIYCKEKCLKLEGFQLQFLDIRKSFKKGKYSFTWFWFLTHFKICMNWPSNSSCGLVLGDYS